MEVAGGVLGSVSLLIQLIDTVEALRAFWESVQDAPRRIASIVVDLKRLRGLLEDRATSLPAPSKLFLDVVSQYESKIAPLENIIEELEPGFRSRRRVIRYLNAYRAHKRNDQIDRFYNVLRDVKADIILVNQQISEYAPPHMQAHLGSDLTFGPDKVNSISSQPSMILSPA